MTPADILPNHIYTNGRGRFRLVTKIRNVGAWQDADYRAAYLNAEGTMKQTMNGITCCSPYALAMWATREATEAEAQAVRAVLP